MKKKSKGQEQDHFLKLPDEIVITIFTKLSQTHLKFLCQSVPLVSKRFAFLILRIPTISISLHPPFIDPLVVLDEFVEIRSLCIQFLVEDENSSNSESMFLKWKDNSNPKSETFVLLSSTSILSNKEYKGKRTMRFRPPPDENLCELRNSLIKKASAKIELNDINQLHNMLFARVASALVGFGDEEGDSCDVQSWGEIITVNMLNWDFEDEEKLFGEALTTIFRNHKDILSRLQSHM